MGVPSEKAADAAAIILEEAEYLDKIDRDDIFDGAVADIDKAVKILIGILAYKFTAPHHRGVDEG